jgi:hypothetical protein
MFFFPLLPQLMYLFNALFSPHTDRVVVPCRASSHLGLRKAWVLSTTMHELDTDKGAGIGPHGKDRPGGETE